MDIPHWFSGALLSPLSFFASAQSPPLASATVSASSQLIPTDGCGVLGIKGELVLKDGDGNDLLLIHKKGGIVQALSIHSKWRGYSYDYQGSPKPVFTLRDPKHSCFSITGSIRISVQPGNCYFDVRGYFPDRDCSIIDSTGNVIAQVKEWIGSRDIYKVVIKPSVDKAFVFGVIAVLDYIYGESTSC